MNELELKYGCNPNQKPARVFHEKRRSPSLYGSQRQARLHQPARRLQLLAARARIEGGDGPSAAASFKHVSPAGAALGLPLDEVDKRVYFVAPDAALSPHRLCLHPRPADASASYGDWAALSDECDAATAAYLKKRGLRRHHRPRLQRRGACHLKDEKGRQVQCRADRPRLCSRAAGAEGCFRHHLRAGAQRLKIDESLLTNIVTENKDLPKGAKRDMLLALITLKYTQSNSVCYVKDAQTVGVGAGQQSRIHCTRLAGQKADNWYLRRHPKVLALVRGRHPPS